MMKVLFQGDSITDAFRKPNEDNPAYQLGNGYVFLVAARLGLQYPSRPFEFVNRGVSGESVHSIARRWQRDTLDHRPDVVSLLAGVNDILQQKSGFTRPSQDEILDSYRELLQQTREVNSEIQFIILEPFLLEVGEITPAMKNQLRPLQKGIASISQDYSTAFVPLQQIFDAAHEVAPASYWAYDGIHPTHAGFQLIANAWIAAANAHRFFEPAL